MTIRPDHSIATNWRPSTTFGGHDLPRWRRDNLSNPRILATSSRAPMVRANDCERALDYAEPFYREKSARANHPEILEQFDHFVDIHNVKALMSGRACKQ